MTVDLIDAILGKVGTVTIDLDPGVTVKFILIDVEKALAGQPSTST